MNEFHRPFTVFSAFWMSFLLLVLMTAFSLLMMLPETGTVSAGTLASASGVVNLASFIALSAYAFSRYGIRLRMGFRVGSAGLAASILATAAGLVILLSELDNLMKKFFPFFNRIEEGLLGILTEPPLVMTVLLLSVVAPVTEEIFFRGILLEGLGRTYGTARAVLVSSLCFALVHLNPVQFSYTLVLGIFLGYVYKAYGSVLPCIILHALINFMPVLFTRIARIPVPGFTETAGEGWLLQPPLLDLAGIVLTALGATGMHLFARGSGTESGTGKDDSPSS